MTVRIGIFGGTFNPIHIGHLLLAETAREALSLDRVVFIPTRQPPHKSAAHLLAGPVRVELIRLAVRDHPAFVASDIELQRDGPSYSIETVKALRQQLPKAALFLLIGQDMLSVRWLAWEELKRLCTIVVAHRSLDAGPGLSRDPCSGSSRARRSRVEGRPGSPTARRQKGIKWLEMPHIDIASSDIRKRLASRRSIRYLVPPAVERYIRQHGLYQKGGGWRDDEVLSVQRRRHD